MTASRTFRCLILALVAGLLAGCWALPQLDSFTLEARVGPSGSLLAYGNCDVPDGVLVLVRAVGGKTYGAQVESAILTPVVKKRYYVDLGLSLPLTYRVEAILSPDFNAPKALPEKAYQFGDPDLILREKDGRWSIRRAAESRIGSAEDQKLLVGRHLSRLEAAARMLERHAAALREIETGNRPGDLARWYRMYLEARRVALPAATGIDPLYPTLYGQIKEADETLQRRFHDTLAKLTGAKDEEDKMEAGWNLVDERIARVKQEVEALQAKAAP
ncbi:MAG: hypothetical protein GX444_19975 [Myxococcales bacterium]|nr:hypothetical protein [Myxococcales bacterium]